MLTRSHKLALLGLIGLSVALSAVFVPILPDTVPTHWNMHGEADDYGSKWVSLLLFPGVLIGMAALMMVLPLLGPFRQNLEAFRVTYGRILITILTTFLGLQLVILLKSAGGEFEIGSSLAIVLGLMMALLGNWLGKVRRNFYVGIRTPWTLANERVWEKTHRVGAWLFMVHGLVTAVTGYFASSVVCFFVLIGGLIAIVIWAVFYSLYWYRRLGAVDELSSATES